MPRAMNQEQVRNLLIHIDSQMDETTKEEIFSQLGHECFYSNHLDQWVDGFEGDIQKLLDTVNVQHRSTYWERLVFSADRSRLTLTGKEVERCACSFAECGDPPLSLCNYCCKHFQQLIFGSILGKRVEVTITESYLRGDKRCSTVIEIR